MPSSSSSSSSPLSSRAIAAAAAASLAAGAALSHLSPSSSPFLFASAKLADRGRVDSARKQQQRRQWQQRKAKASSSRRIKKNGNPIEEGGAAAYRGNRGGDDEKILEGEARRLQHDEEEASEDYVGNDAVGSIRGAGEHQRRDEEEGRSPDDVTMLHPFDDSPDSSDTGGRHLSSQLTGCCTQYISYDAMQMCSLYGEDCESGEQPSHDSGDDSCEQEGLSFIGVSFSVNTARGNPLSYQLCDQFPMENIIDREYEYVMSMDEDGWLVGGGYKSFDYSGKMPYIDSSHTELLRIGSVDPEYGGTTIEQVYEAMESLSFPPFAIFPEYVKGGGGHHSSDDGEDKSVPSSDVTLIVSVVDTYEDGDSYSSYEEFLDDLFDAMDAVGGGPCMDDHDTDPHVSMSRGVKFKSSYHQSQYFYNANLEVAVWQAMYPKGVVIGSEGYASFPPDTGSKNKMHIGYGNLYFFFDRANITQAFLPNRDLSSTEKYYSTLYSGGQSDGFYESTTTIGFDYNKASGSGDNNKEQEYYEHNPYGWNAKMAKHDMTDGWDLPPSCNQEGETFFGIPLSQRSDSKLMSSSSFQDQFDFEYLTDRNFTYIKEFGTNHGWLVGEQIGNGAGSIVDKDTAHIPLFYTGTTNPDMGGMSLDSLIKIAKEINFGTLYIKPAFVFQDDDGSVKLQFEADANSALGYLYSALCQMIGISWNYDSPYNDLGLYTNCAMHAAGDRAKYGCGPENGNSGGFCPQMTLAYRVAFESDDQAAAYLERCNDYVDYWRSLYPSGVAVGTSKFCPDGGCLALFLNRYDIFYAFKPELGGSWVEFMTGTFAPTISPAPTYDGGCDNPHNMHLDNCFKKKHARKATAVAWDSLGSVGQFSLILIAFMSSTLAISIFLARAKRRRQDGESYLSFLIRDIKPKKKKKRKKLRKRVGRGSLDEDLLDDDDEDEGGFRSVPARPGRQSTKNIKSTNKGGRPPRSTKKADQPKRSRSKSRSRRESSSTPKARGGTSGMDMDENVEMVELSKSKDADVKSARSSRSKSRSRRESPDKTMDANVKNTKLSRSRSRSKTARSRSKSKSGRKTPTKVPEAELNRRQLV